MHVSDVSIVKATNYKTPHLFNLLKKSLEFLGGLERIIPSRSKILIKINHLSPSSLPHKAIITHPAFTREIIKLLKQRECQITVGDDVNSYHKDSYSISGYRKVCEEMGVSLVNFKEAGFKEVKTSGEKLNKIHISPLLLESDFILNLPKLKTHSFTAFTGAVKNMFGCIPYGFRLQYHHQFSLPDDFSQMLVDIYACIPPHLTIMDGVEAMEGEGPSAGNPRKTKVILASRDGVAVDAVASRIIGFNPKDILTTYLAQKRGLGKGELDNIRVWGEKIEDVTVPGFKHSAAATGLFRRKIPQRIYAFIQKQLVLLPQVISTHCTGCEECVRICPSGAAISNRKTVWINLSKCIHCMCCHEVCRFGAIKLNRKLVGKIINSSLSVYKKVRSI